MKLIRDKIAEEVKNRTHGEVIELKGKAKSFALGQKLVEEAYEVLEELSKNEVNADKLMEELADVFEILEAIEQYCRDKYDFGIESIQEIQDLKFAKKGGFSNQFMISKGIK